MHTKKIGFILKQNSKSAQNLAKKAFDFIDSKNTQVFVNSESGFKPHSTKIKLYSKDEIVNHSDFLVVFGGDGTLLSMARRMIKKSIPILGFNLGQLGFLTEFKKSEILESLKLALENKLEVTHRTLLECKLLRGKSIVTNSIVANDVVVTKGSIARVFDIDVSINGLPVAPVRGDGLIIATPTGSTAYSLAAGGPIIEPTLPVMILTAIAPHALTLRPLITSDTSTITLIPSPKPKEKLLLTLDGQVSYELELGDTIKISKYKKQTLKIFKSPKRDYYTILREKLKYGFRE
jgi:NAD+ kinase